MHVLFHAHPLDCLAYARGVFVTDLDLGESVYRQSFAPQAWPLLVRHHPTVFGRHLGRNPHFGFISFMASTYVLIRSLRDGSRRSTLLLLWFRLDHCDTSGELSAYWQRLMPPR